MVRYVIDPFSSLIQDLGEGEHNVAELKRMFSQMREDGKSIDELIELVMKSFGLTETEAKKLVMKVLGLDEPSPSPFD